MLDALSGITMSEFQTKLETLGGELRIHESSWGRVKARFGQK